MAYVAQLQRELHAGHVWRPLVVPVQPLLETDAGHEDRVAGVWRADETHCDDVAVDGLDHAFGAVDEAPLDVHVAHDHAQRTRKQTQRVRRHARAMTEHIENLAVQIRADLVGVDAIVAAQRNDVGRLFALHWSRMGWGPGWRSVPGSKGRSWRGQGSEARRAEPGA